MICQRGDLVIQRHNEIRDLQAGLLDIMGVCYDVQIEQALQPITGEELTHTLTSTVGVPGSDRELHFSI